MQHYLAICAIFRNEGRFLPEWIAFHRAVGVEHFYLYDNRSTDDPGRILAPYVGAGLVTLVPWPVDYDAGAQRLAHADGIARARGRSRWLALLDIDEFLMSPVSPTLPVVLRDYEPFAGVAVHWQVYGTSREESLGGRLVTEALVRRAPTQWVRNRRVKVVVDPLRTVAPDGPHNFRFAPAQISVTETGRPLRYREVNRRLRAVRKRLVEWVPTLPIDPYATRMPVVDAVSVERLRINHYVLRSVADWREKTERFRDGRGDGRPSPKYNTVFFNYHDRNDVHDPIAHRWLPQVRDMLRTWA